MITAEENGPQKKGEQWKGCSGCSPSSRDAPPDPVHPAPGPLAQRSALKASWGRACSGNNYIKNRTQWQLGPEAEGSNILGKHRLLPYFPSLGENGAGLGMPECAKQILGAAGLQ